MTGNYLTGSPGHSRFNALRLAALSLVTASLIGVSITFSSDASAKVYRWVDENGKVHFSDRKPSGQSQQAKDISKSVQQTNVDSSTAERRKLESVFARETAEEKRYNREQQQRLNGNTAQHQQACTKARNYLKTIQGKVYFVRDDGSEYTISEKERQQLEAKVKADIAKNCRN